MYRLQISITTQQYEFLQSEAFVTGKSMASVLRDLLDQVIQTQQQEILETDPIWDVIGVAQDIDSPTDISRNVDRYLYGERLQAPENTSNKVAESPDEYAPD
ncbi:MAG TPA: hypothetical protein PKE64_15030 [Anaerolineae bacterium]|nr:hypothetical protein [Anaerolineae bacterium]